MLHRVKKWADIVISVGINKVFIKVNKKLFVPGGLVLHRVKKWDDIAI